MTQRIPWVDEAAALELARDIGIPERQARRGAFRTLANNPAMVKPIYQLLTTLLTNNTLALRLREMIVMRIGWRMKSEYQWFQHYQIATTQAGFSDELLLAIRDWRNPLHARHFHPADLAVLAAVDDTIDRGRITDAVWAECVRHIKDTSVQVEMVVAIGFWIMLGQFFHTFQVPLQEGAMPWQPDGKGPG